jgi:hypothetical protein
LSRTSFISNSIANEFYYFKVNSEDKIVTEQTSLQEILGTSVEYSVGYWYYAVGTVQEDNSITYEWNKSNEFVYDVNGNEVYPNSSVAPAPVPTPVPTPAPAPQPAKEQIAVDGSWGKATTILAQKVFGCSCVDGIVSRQPLVNKKYLEGAYEGSWQFTDNYNGGSSLIKAIQNWLGIKADGYMGKGSVMALQSRLGVRADGYMGKNTVKAFQKWLNNR